MSPTEKLYGAFVKAAERRDKATVLRLIREHPGIHNFEGDHGSLIAIIGCNCPDFFSDAFQAGLHPDSGSENSLETTFQSFVAKDDLETVRLFLRHGVNLERRNAMGETPLGYAVAWASLEMVKLLVEAGAQVNAIETGPEGFYNTALDSTIGRDPAEGRQPIVEFLRSKGAKTYNELVSDGKLDA